MFRENTRPISYVKAHTAYWTADNQTGLVFTLFGVNGQVEAKGYMKVLGRPGNPGKSGKPGSRHPDIVKDVVAEALDKILARQFSEIRRRAYNEGWRDRGSRKKKKSEFSCEQNPVWAPIGC